MKTLEFRDGERDVPDHMEVMMRGLETHTMTYEEALRASEHKMASDFLNRAQGKVVSDHMRDLVR